MLVGRPTPRGCDGVDVYPEVRGLQWLLLFCLVKPSTPLYSLLKKIVAVWITFKTRDPGQIYHLVLELNHWLVRVLL